MIAYALKIDRYPNELRNERQTSIDAILRPMVVTREAVQKEEAQLCEANALICCESSPLRFYTLSNMIRVVAIQDQQSHNPEYRRSLQQVVIVVIVGILLCISPGVPRWRESQDEYDQACTTGLFAQEVREVGDQGDIEKVKEELEAACDSLLLCGFLELTIVEVLECFRPTNQVSSLLWLALHCTIVVRIASITATRHGTNIQPLRKAQDVASEVVSALTSW